jgi:hypothetical protein
MADSTALLPAALIIRKCAVRFKFMADKVNTSLTESQRMILKLLKHRTAQVLLKFLHLYQPANLPPNQKFTLRLKNHGVRSLVTGDLIRIGFNIERSEIIQAAEETIYITQAFPSGATRDFNLTTAFDFRIGGDYHTNVFTVETVPYFYNQISSDTLYRLIQVKSR